ncbi:MAG TPA: type II toxin-antitoxin system HicB family antitoxin [Desulfuromonadales bacterium]|jgi:predicted HicB family RNase H-like nuclease
MKDMMRYRNYFGSVHYSDEDRVFFGRVEFIRALVSYEGTDVTSLRLSFEEAVDDYLETCKAEGVAPEKPFKGSFNVRVGAALHQRIAIAAAQRGMTLNKYIVEVLERESGKKVQV